MLRALDLQEFSISGFGKICIIWDILNTDNLENAGLSECAPFCVT